MGSHAPLSTRSPRTHTHDTSYDSTRVEGLVEPHSCGWDKVPKGAYCGCANHSTSISLPSSSRSRTTYYIPERRKTFVTLIFFVLTVFLNHFVLAIISDIISRDPLPDLMHSLIQQSELSRKLADWFAFAGSLGTFLLVCLFHKYRWIVARRLWYIGSVLFLMRAVSICVTHIPASYEDNTRICTEPSDSPNPSYQRLMENFARVFVTMGLQVTDSTNHLFCGDMLFSGHTTTISTCCFFLNYYMPHSLWPIKIVLVVCCLIAMICLIGSRAHYTVDVVMGYWISSIVFSLYHAYCEIPHEVRPQTRAFRRLFIFWTMFETERKVPAGRLPNQLEWPLPWPKSFKKFFEDFSDQSEDTWPGRMAKWLAQHRIKFHM